VAYFPVKEIAEPKTIVSCALAEEIPNVSAIAEINVTKTFFSFLISVPF
jgi:hypothetical protein